LTSISPFDIALLLPAVGGTVYALLCLLAGLWFMRRPARTLEPLHAWPAVSVLKPVCGLEKDLGMNLRSACVQDYPAPLQVVFSVQDSADPALPLLRALEREFGPERVTLAVGGPRLGPNGKASNLALALAHARHDCLVISDSDIHVPPDYLQAIVAPLSDSRVGYVCTLYRAVGARNVWDELELLTVNTELLPNFVFARATRAAPACIGASTALRRETLERIGGFEALASHLVEDYEMGKRIRALGLRAVFLPYLVDTTVDLDSASSWWKHHVYWEQNTRAANPGGATAFVLVRGVPFALLFALARGLDPLGLGVAATAVAVRLVCAALFARWVARESETLRALWLLPLRDVAGLASWAVALFSRTAHWRGRELALDRAGRILSAPARERALVITGDDFGLAVPVNEAIEIAHRRGLRHHQARAPQHAAAGDAVERARRNPGLRVGLHLVVCDGHPALPPNEIPALVDASGRLSSHVLRTSFRVFLSPGARRQLARELRAQFEAFARTGLALDHVDGHGHLHLHPIVSKIALRVGRDFAMPAMRVPREPGGRSARAARRGWVSRQLAQALLSPWVALLRRRLRRAGVRCNDWIFGLHDTGHMRTALLARLLADLPPGTTEIYFHPATRRCPELDRTMPDYEHERELETLTSAVLRDAVIASGAELRSLGSL